jgi:arginase family enzyme
MMMKETENLEENKVIFFGCPLDCDERGESIQEKLSSMAGMVENRDPYECVMAFIRKEVPGDLWEEMGSLDVPEWLCPVPPVDQKEFMNPDNFVAFVDGGGCETFSNMLRDHVIGEIHPNLPCMITVDHSLTGGAFQKLAEFYGPENLSLIVLDSHTDAVPVSIMSGAVAYDMESNQNSFYDAEDPFLKNRQDSFNASSFIRYLLEQKTVSHNNLYIIGPGDFPSKRSFRVKDERIRKYVSIFSDLKRKGAKILTKKDLISNPSRLKNTLKNINTPYVYISIDMDIGAGNALEGVRFRNRHGLNEKQINNIGLHLQSLLSNGCELVGMDINEINARNVKMGDRTCRIAANLIKMLCFNLE